MAPAKTLRRLARAGDRAVAVGFVMILASACSPRHASHLASHTGDDLRATAELPAEDSLGVVDDILSSSADPNEARELMTAKPWQSVGDRDPSRRARARPGKPVPVFSNATLDIAAGADRREVRGRVGIGGKLLLGFRSRETSALGFLSLQRVGFVHSLVVGHLTLRMGERLMLGRGFRSYQTITAGGVGAGLVAAPSLSRWFGRPGVAIATGTKRWRFQTALLSRAKAPARLQPSIVWLTLQRRSSSTRVGLTAGIPVEEASTATGRIASKVFSLHASHDSDHFNCSGEYVYRVDGDAFFAFRIFGTSRYRWAVRYYLAPVFSSAAVPAVDPTPKRGVLRGAIAKVERPSGAVKLRLTISLGTRRSLHERQLFRRTAVSLVRRFLSTDWECTILAREQVNPDLPAGSLVVPSTAKKEREIRVRAAFRAGSERRLYHTVRCDYVPGHGWRGDGMLLAVTTGVGLGRLQARLHVAAYSFASGRRGFITRPGVGAFEWFSSVYGQGSDVALRIRLRVREGVSALVYYGEPWLKDRRMYVGLQARLR